MMTGELPTPGLPTGDAAFDLLLGAPVLTTPGLTTPGLTAPGLTAPLAAKTVPEFDFSDRAVRRHRVTSPVDWISLVLAVIAPPVGLVTSIVSRIVSYRRFGRTSAVARAATIVAIIFSIAVAAAFVVVQSFRDADAAHAALVADAQPFCVAVAETPGVLDTPGFGWPTEVTAIPETVVAIEAYQARWAALAAVAPAAIKADATALADGAASIVQSIQATSVIDRQHNLDKATLIASSSGIAAWATTFCG